MPPFSSAQLLEASASGGAVVSTHSAASRVVAVGEGHRTTRQSSVALKPTTTTTIKTISEETKLSQNNSQDQDQNQDEDHYEAPIVWRNIFLFIVLHSAIPAASFLRPQWKTLLWSFVSMYMSGIGVTGGAHRLWSHKAYKAKWPLQVLLMLLQTMAGQNSIYTWCRDHRVHHKFSETHADPHNIKRGFFFAHMGWLCCKKHPEVRTKGALIDMTDLESNPVVMFQHRNFWWLAILFTVYLPMMIPVWLWREHLWTSFIFSFMIRYLFVLHGTWLVNSAAHYFGSRPYDARIEARESPLVILYGLGEGFHNYHHTFPHDYSTSEFGKYFNITTAFIDLCAWLGLVYERRKIDKEIIRRRQQRTGNKRPLWATACADLIENDSLGGQQPKPEPLATIEKRRLELEL